MAAVNQSFWSLLTGQNEWAVLTTLVYILCWVMVGQSVASELYLLQVSEYRLLRLLSGCWETSEHLTSLRMPAPKWNNLLSLHLMKVLDAYYFCFLFKQPVFNVTRDYTRSRKNEILGIVEEQARRLRCQQQCESTDCSLKTLVWLNWSCLSSTSYNVFYFAYSFHLAGCTCHHSLRMHVLCFFLIQKI